MTSLVPRALRIWSDEGWGNEIRFDQSMANMLQVPRRIVDTHSLDCTEWATSVLWQVGGERDRPYLNRKAKVLWRTNQTTDMISETTFVGNLVIGLGRYQDVREVLWWGEDMCSDPLCKLVHERFGKIHAEGTVDNPGKRQMLKEDWTLEVMRDLRNQEADGIPEMFRRCRKVWTMGSLWLATKKQWGTQGMAFRLSNGKFMRDLVVQVTAPVAQLGKQPIYFTNTGDIQVLGGPIPQVAINWVGNATFSEVEFGTLMEVDNWITLGGALRGVYRFPNVDRLSNAEQLVLAAQVGVAIGQRTSVLQGRRAAREEKEIDEHGEVTTKVRPERGELVAFMMYVATGGALINIETFFDLYEELVDRCEA